MNTYSSFWRKHRSSDEVTEHILCLRALRKVAGTIGSNVKPVYWKGMVDEDNRSILLDADAIKGGYPVSYDVFDIMVGQVALEALSTREWRDWVTDTAILQASCDEYIVKKYMIKIVAAAEDIYIHHLARSSVWSLYLSRYWRADLNKNRRDPNLPPGPTSLADAWRCEAIFGERPDRLHPYYSRPLKIMRQHTDGLCEIVSMAPLSQRRTLRSRLYVNIWQQIAIALAEWETFQDDPDAVNFIDESAQHRGNCENPDQKDDDQPEEAQTTGDADDDLMDRIKEAVDDNRPSDVTHAIAVAVEDPEAGKMETVVKQSAAVCDIQPDALQVLRLSNLFSAHRHELRRLRKKVTKKRLIEGKIDPRRLYRTSFDGRIFKKKEMTEHDGAWHICIVADSSASMGKKVGGSRPWQIAEKTFSSLAAAVGEFDNRIDIYAYCEDEGICVLTRLFHDKTLYTVVPKGRTPSGQAIIAAALSMNSKYQNKMIVHISDGAANCGVNMGIAIEYCRSTGVDLFSIGCGCNTQTKDFLRGYFSADQLCFVDDITGLPGIIEGLFRQKMMFFPK